MVIIRDMHGQIPCRVLNGSNNSICRCAKLKIITIDATIRAFVAQQREWLEQELHAESENNNVDPTTSATAAAAATAEDQQRRDAVVLHQLEVESVAVGLYGRTVVRFASGAKVAAGGVALLPSHRFTTGDEVEIRTKTSGSRRNSPAGVVSAVTEDSISVALFPASSSSSNKTKKQHPSKDDDDDDDDDMLGSPPYSLIPRSNVQVHRKLMAALDELDSHGANHPVAGKVVQALFQVGDSTSVSIESSSGATIITHSNNLNNPDLDESQLEAIQFALQSNRSLSLIHGPPGTGKTTTVCELIQQAVQQHKWKVLVTAPSNVAVDNVLARLVAHQTSNNNKQQRRKSKKSAIGNSKKQQRLNVVRLGHPARLQEAILPYSLEALVQTADGTEIVADVREELQSYLKILAAAPSKKGAADRDKKRLAYREVKALRKEVRQREEKTVQDLLDASHVVLATCVGAANQKLLQHQHFDLVVIDEAAQALEAACWIPALRAGTKLVLAGDHCQLPPTIQSSNAAVQAGLSVTMFERAMALYGDASGGDGGSGRVSRMLRVQYRMHERIANWASRALYGNSLQTHESVAARTLGQLPHTTAAGIGAAEISGLQDTPLLLLDTAGCAMYEEENAAGSRSNEGEAELVVQHARKLIVDMGIPPEQIAVISPYNGQVELLRLALLPEFPKLQIRSVDGFQGGEREAVIISLVRSSERGGRDGIGFLRDNRRLNVAVTRAKRHCCIICDTETVSQSPFVKGLIEWIEKHGEQRSALEVSGEADDGAQMDADLALAELELERLMIEEKNDSIKRKNGSSSDRKAAVSPAEIERRREALLVRIQNFQAKANPGEEMIMSTELSKLDRKLVHEIAEELGLIHQSDGVEGVDRRIKLSIPADDTKADENTTDRAASASSGLSTGVTEPQHVGVEVDDGGGGGTAEIPVETIEPTPSAFSALQLDGDYDEDDDTESGYTQCAKTANEASVEGAKPDMNNVLSGLARERAQREKQKKQQEKAAAKTPPAKKKPAPKKKGKLGGTKKAQPKEDEGLDDLDDMAFLDAQINKVQTSHGRTINASGSSYKTIMNGVLMAKPNRPAEKKKDAKAAAALHVKLKNAQDGRKAKNKKK